MRLACKHSMRHVESYAGSWYAMISPTSMGYSMHCMHRICSNNGWSRASWKVLQVTAGIKLTNARTKDPKNNNVLLFREDGITGLQSRNVCFPLKVVIGKDNKDLLKNEFKSFYDEINLFEELYGNNNDNNKPSLEVCHPGDMSALQKLVG